MDRNWHKDLEIRRPTATAFLPPPTVEESSWDILLALHADRCFDLSLGKLAALISVHPAILSHRLTSLEGRELVTAAYLHDEPRAALTSAGRELLDRYLSATSDLDARTH